MLGITFIDHKLLTKVMNSLFFSIGSLSDMQHIELELKQGHLLYKKTNITVCDASDSGLIDLVVFICSEL